MATTPLCKCRVLYLGSYVPTITKDGLQGIQEPLRQRYPSEDSLEAKGIDAWLSVWSNGLLLEYIEGRKKIEAAFFPIYSLHYCAAVRYVNVGGYELEGGGEQFLPLDSPFANLPGGKKHPPLFAANLRRTTGIKVLECHTFVCMNERAANALVKCCFHAYADSVYLKIDELKPPMKQALAKSSPKHRDDRQFDTSSNDGSIESIHSRDSNKEVSTVQSLEISPNDCEVLRWSGSKTKSAWQKRQQSGEYDAISISSDLANRYQPRPKVGDGSIVSNRESALTEPELDLVVRSPNVFSYETWRDRNALQFNSMNGEPHYLPAVMPPFDFHPNIPPSMHHQRQAMSPPPPWLHNPPPFFHPPFPPMNPSDHLDMRPFGLPPPMHLPPDPAFIRSPSDESASPLTSPDGVYFPHPHHPPIEFMRPPVPMGFPPPPIAHRGGGPIYSTLPRNGRDLSSPLTMERPDNFNAGTFRSSAGATSPQFGPRGFMPAGQHQHHPHAMPFHHGNPHLPMTNAMQYSENQSGKH